jgi:hypothetical protein
VVHDRVKVAGSPTRVLAVMNDPEIVREWVASQHASEHEWTTDEAVLARTRLWLSTPLAHASAPFDKWVGATYELRDERAWRPSKGGDGGVETDLDVHPVSGSRGGHLVGSVHVLPDGPDSVIELSGSLQIEGVPWVAAKVLRIPAEKASCRS